MKLTERRWVAFPRKSNTRISRSDIGEKRIRQIAEITESNAKKATKKKRALGMTKEEFRDAVMRERGMK